MPSSIDTTFSQGDIHFRSADVAPPVAIDQRHRCFVIDDDTVIRDLIKNILHPFDIAVWEFNAAAAALDAVKDHDPELVFLDVSLEASDAIDVIRGLAKQRFKGVVQLVSGRTGSLPSDIKAIGERYGLKMRPPLTKPFSVSAMRSIIIEEGLSVPILSTHPLSLAEALDKNWLELWYQPKIDLRTKMLAGVEGFVRARHPVHGISAPSAFLDTASKTDLAALSDFVIMSAMVDWASFYQAGFRMKIAINVPPGGIGTLISANLFREIRPKRAEWPGLVIDVNASEVAQNIGLTHEIATQLSLYDAWLAIEDFHPEDALARQLERIPFCELKLDRKYVFNCATDSAKRKVCQNTINLAHRFGKLVVAEGVENETDKQTLLQLGCDSAQGNLFSPPVQKEKLIRILTSRLRKHF